MAETVQGTAFGSRLPWERTIGGGVDEIAERMGSSLSEATTGLDWIIRTGIAVRSGGGRFSVPEDLWAPAPVLTSIAWSHVREQLRSQARLHGIRSHSGRLAPALAVLRALAERPEALRAAAVAEAVASAVTPHERSGDVIGDDAWGKISVAHLINATLFGRSAVLDAIGRLEAAAVIARRRFPGSHEGDEVQLLPAAFGRNNPTNAASPATDLLTRPHASAASTLAPSPPSVSTALAETPHGTASIQLPPRNSSQQLVPVTVAGVTMHVPPGTKVTIDVDTAGRRTIHVGDDIVIGPLS